MFHNVLFKLNFQCRQPGDGYGSARGFIRGGRIMGGGRGFGE